MKAEFRFRQNGTFQIIVDGHESEVANDDGLAIVTVNNDIYIGVTEYHKEIIPSNQVFKLSREKVETEVTTRFFCNICGKSEVVPDDANTDWMLAEYKESGQDLQFLTGFNRTYLACPDHRGESKVIGGRNIKYLDEKPEGYLYLPEG